MSDKKILELKGITKEYPGVLALDNVSMDFNKGEVHALLGENGAGKSTLIKVLSGAIIPNRGEIVFEGDTYGYMTPALAQKLGIGVIYQEFNLVPSLSVADNIFLGDEIRKGIIRDRKQMMKKSEELLSSLKINISPAALISDLSVAYRQIVEIVKAVSKNVKVLIMDEPSAPLTNNEVEAMFELIKRLKSQGVTIIYISHRIEELFRISDRVTVLRDGQYICTKNTSDTNRTELISLMVGRPLTEQYPERNSDIGDIMLEVKGLNAGGLLKDINFQVKKGEILGISGLVGAGRTELARAIFGADEIESGEIYIEGQKINIKSPKEAIKHGIALIPEDRKQQGLLLEMSVAHNITFANIKEMCKNTIISIKKEKELVDDSILKLRIKTPSAAQRVKNLSGGNQQKVVLAKWLAAYSRIMIFDEPTRGIDVGSKHEIYMLMNQLANEGKAIIMISSELPELLGMADRILVMHEGEITGELSKEEATQDSIMNLASGKNTIER
ncbi:MAG: sugar ABC transporter ATP-binding protein [Acetivibrionales bacterium]